MHFIPPHSAQQFSIINPISIHEPTNSSATWFWTRFLLLRQAHKTFRSVSRFLTFSETIAVRNNFIRIARANISALRRTTPASATVKWEINWRQLYELARARDRHYYYRYTRSFAPCHVTLSINRVTNLLILLFLFPSEYCCSFCSSNLHLLPLSFLPPLSLA